MNNLLGTDTQTHPAVKLSEIDPNPYRRFDLNRSTRIVRERDGRYQLAYGHHRIEAARQELGPDAIVRVIVRNLDDMMIRVMLDENSGAVASTPAPTILESENPYQDSGTSPPLPRVTA